MTVEIISWSISAKVWYWAGIKLTTPGSAVRHPSVARHVTDCATRPGAGLMNFNFFGSPKDGFLMVLCIQGFPGLKFESLRLSKCCLGLSNNNLEGPTGLSKILKEFTKTVFSRCYAYRVFLDSSLRVSDFQNAVWDSRIIILRVLQDSQKFWRSLQFNWFFKQIAFEIK